MSHSESNTATLEIAEPPVIFQPDIRDQKLVADRPLERLQDAVQNVADMIAPVLPLRDFVAVNPYLGLSNRSFLKARQLLRSVCDCETLMPLNYFQERYARGDFSHEDVCSAVDELNSQDERLALTPDEVMNALKNSDQNGSRTNVPSASRRIRTLSESVDTGGASNFSDLIREEIGRHLSAYYDEGQASWANPNKHLSLFQAWRSAAEHDRRLSLMGVSGCNRLIASLPDSEIATLSFLLKRIAMPEELWEPFLLCLAHSIPGWSAWTRYDTERDDQSEWNLAFVSLLAIRLAYDVAVAEAAKFTVDWHSAIKVRTIAERNSNQNSGHEDVIRFALLRASEVAFQRQLLNSLSTPNTTSPEQDFQSEHQQPLAQLVFCIDVRSERYRRNLESVTESVETFGFAGFFGMPIAFQGFGEETASPQVPALLSPAFTVKEGMRDSKTPESSVLNRRQLRRLFRKTWKRFQSSAVSCFGFVETAGLGYGWNLVSKSLHRNNPIGTKFDGVAAGDRQKLGPILSGLEEQGVDLSKQIDLAEGALRGIGLTGNFAKLIVFCGHGSQVQNNPLQAGLDCGACCGHSGEPNARFAAALLNQRSVRNGLAERGIRIPTETHFLAGLHNTTNDEVRLFETDMVPGFLSDAVRKLDVFTTEATGLTQLERLPQLNATNAADVVQRTLDWSEVRPEWGLAGNAAFIVAPRELTQHVNLDGRSFLHSYDYRTDEDFRVLEQIMTAPMVVGHWINMQYYASTVDNLHFGSGSKTIHNVVGRFGLFSGNGGDLTTGLPWQSVHNGKDYQHEPLRLLSVIAAPREAVSQIIERHKDVEELLVNGWLNLVVMEDDKFHRYTTTQSWQPVETQVTTPA